MYHEVKTPYNIPQTRTPISLPFSPYLVLLFRNEVTKRHRNDESPIINLVVGDP